MTETAATTAQDILVVGGGITGLAAATLLAQARRSVTLFEKSRAVGGRAATQVNEGFHFNLGPHALFRAGRGAQVLRELGIDTNFGGGTAPLSGSCAVNGGAEHSFPKGVFSLFATRLLGFSAKLEAASVFASLKKIDPQPIQSVTLQQWINHRIHHLDVRRLLVALFRLATYSDDPEHQSAGAALAQLQMSMADSVFYLDSGWQVLVERLRLAAKEAGVRIVTGTPVMAIEHDEAVRGIRLADGTTRAAESVIVASSPTVACNLMKGNGESVLSEWARAAIPVRASCLDVALERLPRPRARFALGIDAPLYFSVHSAAARLAPEGGALIHVARYLRQSEPADSRAIEQELEGLLDLVQPGWRRVVVKRRFLPNMVVSNALVTAEQGGTAGRPGPAVPGVRNLYVAGDWVGAEGMLSDASLASARRAAELALTVGRDARRPALATALS